MSGKPPCLAKTVLFIRVSSVNWPGTQLIGRSVVDGPVEPSRCNRNAEYLVKPSEPMAVHPAFFTVFAESCYCHWMTVDRSLFATTFGMLPEWPCPTCGKGHLKVNKDALLINETGPSKADHEHPAWDPDWMKHRFAGLLTCNFGNCGDLVAILGDVSIVEEHDYNYDGEPTQEFIEHFRPRSLSPAPLPIRPPEEAPQLVKDALREAAGLIWQSAEGAANQVRQAVEHLMDAQGITKSAPGAYLSLHARIEKFKVMDAKNAEILLAVKWLGNSGSHAGGLTRDDVFDAFDMVELVLVNLYDMTTAMIMAKVNAVNNQKGPVKPTP